MKVLMVIMKYDYGIEDNGYSYEYLNYYKTLEAMGYDVELFDFMSELKNSSKEKMNQKLVDTIKVNKPDVTLFHLYTDQFLPDVIESLQAYTKTVSIFHDDTWRKDFTEFWREKFTYFTTPDTFIFNENKRLGLKQCCYFPYGVDDSVYTKTDKSIIYDVSFVGRKHPYREWLLNKIKKSGINAQFFGPGWESGPLTHAQMIEVFGRSKINLNLSNASSWDFRYLLSSLRAIIDRFRSKKIIEQVKARHIEIPSCGGFQLSYYVPGLERLMSIGDEIGVYVGADDLITKIKYYLDNDDVRKDIAEKGYMRVKKDHIFQVRFEKFFNEIGVK